VWVNDDLNKNFPILSKDLAKSSSTDLIYIGKKSLHDFNNFEDYLQYGKTQGMEYLVLDGHNLHNQMLIHVFENEEEYPFLKKIFDKKIKPTFLKEFKNFIFGSIEYDYPFHVKAFKIDYNEFENIRKNE
jgi:sulfatase maturation enzyme AslB (radical SAM superfamily)